MTVVGTQDGISMQKHSCCPILSFPSSSVKVCLAWIKWSMSMQSIPGAKLVSFANSLIQRSPFPCDQRATSLLSHTAWLLPKRDTRDHNDAIVILASNCNGRKWTFLRDKQTRGFDTSTFATMSGEVMMLA